MGDTALYVRLDERALPFVLRLRVGQGRYVRIGDKSIDRENLRLNPVSKLANGVEQAQLE